MLNKNLLILLMALTLFLPSCGKETGSTSPASGTNVTGTGGTTGTTTTSTSAANVALTATPSSITTLGSSSIRATVTTSSGGNVSDGTTVSFTVSSIIMGTVTSSATTSGGVATATFTALSVPGTVTITATANGISQTVAITITAPANGSIVYTSASPQAIGIKGSGQTEISTLIFAVKDINGSAVVDGTSVSFTMSGPSGGKLPSNGGEYIGDIDTTPTTATASTTGGNATIFLHSGSVAGPVTVTASVTTSSGTTISASSAVVSIGGGAPSATHFNLATTKFNLPGLVVSNSQATISAYIADRFGNYNVLTGTSVSFYTEAGAIDTSNTLDATGITSALFRTQAPNPADVSPVIWETTLISSLNLTYGLSIPTTTTPRDGWVKVLATVQGEEAFLDENGNGLFDSSYNTTACPTGYTCQCSSGSVTGPSSCSSGNRSEGFIDLGEPFIDKNDNNSRDDGQTSGAPFEEFIDSNGSGTYTSPNGLWDGPSCATSGCQTSKMIWTSITLAFTGNASYCAITPTSFTIANAGSQSFSFMVGDINTNHLVSGTTIAITASKGTLSGTTSYTVLDGVPQGPTILFFTLTDAAATTTASPPDPATVTVTVSSSSVVVCPPVIASGTIQ